MQMSTQSRRTADRDGAEQPPLAEAQDILRLHRPAMATKDFRDGESRLEMAGFGEHRQGGRSPRTSVLEVFRWVATCRYRSVLEMLR